MKKGKCKELKLNINRRKNIKRIIRIKLFKKKENDNRKWEVQETVLKKRMEKTNRMREEKKEKWMLKRKEKRRQKETR